MPVQHICQIAHVNITEPTSVAACGVLEKDFYTFVLRVQRKNRKKTQGPNIPVPQAQAKGQITHKPGGDFDLFYQVSGWQWGGGMHVHEWAFTWAFLVPDVEGMFTPLERLPPMHTNIESERNTQLGLQVLKLLQENKIFIQKMDENGFLHIV